MKHLRLPLPPPKIYDGPPAPSTERPRHLALNACNIPLTCDTCGHDRQWHRPGKCFGHYDECVCDGYVPW